MRCFNHQYIFIYLIINSLISFGFSFVSFNHPISLKRRIGQCKDNENNVVDSSKYIDNKDGTFLTLGGLSSAGMIEMGYLNYMKTNLGELCGDKGCSAVLSGPYSIIPIANIPLTTIALLGYSIIAGISLLYFISADKDIDENMKMLTLSITTAMATFSCYLMGVLNFVLHIFCPYCYASAFISLALATVAYTKKVVPSTTKSTVVFATTTAITALSSAFIFFVTSSLNPSNAYAVVNTPNVQTSVSPAETIETVFEPPTITAVSSKEALKIAEKLKKYNAKMYGAYWCSHCFNQKQNLGKEAYSSFEYVECDKKGFNSQYQTCKNKKLKGYPTWEINGQFFPGEKTVQELSEVLKQIELKIVADN